MGASSVRRSFQHGRDTGTILQEIVSTENSWPSFLKKRKFRKQKKNESNLSFKRNHFYSFRAINFFLNKTQQTPKYPDPSDGLASFLRTKTPLPLRHTGWNSPETIAGSQPIPRLGILGITAYWTTRIRTNMGRGSKATGYFLHYIGCRLGILISCFYYYVVISIVAVCSIVV